MISVLTVNYHTPDDAAGLARSLRACGDRAPVELIVTDHSAEEGLELPSDDRLPITVLPASNAGFAAGVNRAFRHSRGEIIMVVNPDVRVVDGTLDKATAYLADHPDVGVALPRLVYPDGQVQPSVRRFYTWPVVLYARSPLRSLVAPPRFFRHYLCDDIDRSAPIDVDWGLGAAMFIRRADCERDAVFDDRFFMYFEDVDLCLRMWQRGRRVVYRPELVCEHVHRRHSSNPFSRAGWNHVQSLTRFVVKHRGLPRRPLRSAPRPSRRAVPVGATMYARH